LGLAVQKGVEFGAVHLIEDQICECKHCRSAIAVAAKQTHFTEQTDGLSYTQAMFISIAYRFENFDLTLQ
jgi:hypothetical protein